MRRARAVTAANAQARRFGGGGSGGSSGSYPSTLTLAANGTSSTFITKYTSGGKLIWTALQTSSSDAGSTAACGPVATDSSGNILHFVRYAYNLVIYNSDGTTSSLSLPNANSTQREAGVIKYNQSGIAQWATRIGGTGTDSQNNTQCIATDSLDNIYVVGYYNSSPTTIYNADGTSFGTLDYIGAPGFSIFLVKYNSSGVAQWAARMGSTGSGNYENPNGIHVNSSGIYIGGVYGGSNFTAYNSDGSTFSTTLAKQVAGDIFLLKYDSSGFVQWATRMAGGANDYAYSIKGDSSGNIYIGGFYTSSPFTFYNSDGSAFATTFTNQGGTDGFFAKYNSYGFVQSVTRIGGTGTQIVNTMVTDSSNNIYIIGYYGGNASTIYNADGSTFTTISTNNGNTDIFIVKYNSSGVAQWVTRIGGTGDENPYFVDIDSFNNIYICGSYTSNPLNIYNSDGSTFGTTLTNSGSGYDSFLVKYNSSGVAQWATRVGGTGTADYLIGVRLDSSDNIYTTGYYNSNPLTLYSA